MKHDDFQFRLIYRKSPLIINRRLIMNHLFSWDIFHGYIKQTEVFFCPGIYGFTTENRNSTTDTYPQNWRSSGFFLPWVADWKAACLSNWRILRVQFLGRW